VFFILLGFLLVHLRLIAVDPMSRAIALVLGVMFLCLYFALGYTFWVSYFVALLFLRGLLVIIFFCTVLCKSVLYPL
jgi:hypothetical protein